jgi:hypothetical protein
MHYAEFDIELLTDVSLPARSSSLDDAGSRHFIPGASLLGCVARRIHDALDPESAFRIFQTAAVRFLDALPEVGSERGLPMPRSLHQPKALNASGLLNLAFTARPENVQLKPFGTDTWVSPDLTRQTALHTTTTMRTAIQPDGRALDGLLYSLDVLPAGLRFRALVAAASEADLGTVAKALASDHHVGRARGTEIGRIRISRRSTTPKFPAPAVAETISFLCVSSLALRDADTGMPTFTPRASDFGLPAGWDLDLEKSFIRTERFTPHHGKRSLPDLERQLIERGSVLTFKRDSAPPLDPARVSAQIARGVGEYRNAGHGEIRVMTDALLAERLAPPQRVAPATRQITAVSAPTDDLFRWAHALTKKRDAISAQFEWATQQSQKAGRWGIPPSQWGVIRRMAREGRVSNLSPAEFIQRLQAHVKGEANRDATDPARPAPRGERGVAQTERGWGRSVGKDSAADWLLKVLDSQDDPAAAAEILAELVVRAARKREDLR